MLRRLTAITILVAAQMQVQVAKAQSSAPPNHSETLSSAAHDFGVKLSQRSYAAMRFSGRSFEGAIIEEFERTPVTAYGDGVDFAVVRYSSATVKDAYYKARLRPLSNITKLGRATVSVQLIDSAGKVAHVNNSVVNVFSLALPKEAEKLGAMLEFSSNAMTKRDRMSTPPLHEVDLLGTVCCSNGMCGICIGRGCPQR